MEIINIEAGTFKEMNEVLNNFIQTVQSKNRHTDKKLDEWIDNQEACILMDISPRKLLTLRRTGAIPYSKIDRKVYYKKREIMHYMEKALEKGTTKKETI